MNYDKKVEVIRNGAYPVIMELTIKNKNLTVKINGLVMFIDLCRYLIENSPILQTEHKRVCPYKLRIDKVHDNKTFSHRAYFIDYLEIDNNRLEEKTSHIIDLLSFNMKIKGELELYIPDLLLVMHERKYVSLSSNQNRFNSIRNFNTEVEYKEVCELLSPDTLKQKGFTVPATYERNYEKRLG